MRPPASPRASPARSPRPPPLSELARLLWKRIPAAAKEGNAELAAVWQLLCALWRRDYAGVGVALASPDFSAPSRLLLDAVVAQHRKETLELLSVAYTTISLADAAEALALPPAQTLEAVTAAGWRPLEGEGDWLSVARPAQAPESGADAISIEQLQDFLASRAG